MVQRNLVEQDFHVFNRIHGNPRLAHISGNPRIIGIVAAMSGQVKRDRKPLLASRQIFAVKSIGFMRC